MLCSSRCAKCETQFDVKIQLTIKMACADWPNGCPHVQSFKHIELGVLNVSVLHNDACHVPGSSMPKQSTPADVSLYVAGNVKML